MTYSIKNALSAICDVRIGYTARQGLKTTPGGIRAIQLRDLHEEDDLDPASAPLYPLDPSLKQRYSAGAGDLLFRSRGNRNTAVMIAPDSTEAVVAVLPLIAPQECGILAPPSSGRWTCHKDCPLGECCG